jgi:hypothetical protein
MLGKGVGYSLCVQAEQHLRTEGFIAVILWVLKDNERAVKFYQSNGFVPDIGATKEIERGGKTLSSSESRLSPVRIDSPESRSAFTNPARVTHDSDIRGCKMSAARFPRAVHFRPKSPANCRWRGGRGRVVV